MISNKMSLQKKNEQLQKREEFAYFLHRFVITRESFFIADESCLKDPGLLNRDIQNRLREVSNFGDGDCGAGEIHAHAKDREDRREGSAEFSALPSRRVSSNFRARVCILSVPQSPSPKLETTRSLHPEYPAK